MTASGRLHQPDPGDTPKQIGAGRDPGVQTLLNQNLRRAFFQAFCFIIRVIRTDAFREPILTSISSPDSYHSWP
jgi:hypothetical protein